jgi:hypothetical protein
VGYVSVTSFNPDEVNFAVWIPEKKEWLYHVVTTPHDGKEEVISKAWYRPGEVFRYNVSMRVDEDFKFEPGGEYYLYIGTYSRSRSFHSPENYHWDYRYKFVLPES